MAKQLLLFALVVTALRAQTVTLSAPGSSASAPGFTVELIGPGSNCAALPEECVGDELYVWAYIDGQGTFGVTLTTSEGTQSQLQEGAGIVLFQLDGDFESMTVTNMSPKKTTTAVLKKASKR